MTRAARPTPMLLLVATVALAAIGCARRESARGPSPTRDVQTAGETGPVTAQVTVEPTTLTTAQRLTVRLRATFAPGTRPADADLTEALPEGMSIVESRADRTAGDAGATVLTQTVTIEPFLAGTYELGSFTIAAASEKEGDAPPSVRTRPVAITVTSVLTGDDADLAGPKSIVDPPADSRAWLWALLAAAGAALIAAAWAWRRRRAAHAPAPVLVPAHDLALRRLDALLARRLVEAGRFGEFYAEASFILRRYIEDRFGMHAPERTTEEFLDECRAAPFLTHDDVGVLRTFLSHCDMVKFAAVIPSEREARRVADTVREFVDRTRDSAKVVAESTEPAPPPPVQEAAA